MKKLDWLKQLILIGSLTLAFGFARAPTTQATAPTQASPDPSLPANKIIYTAIGDSITFGLWSSNPCPAKTPVRLAENCQTGTAFPDRVSQRLAKNHEVIEQNLGISGATIGDVVHDEIPSVQESPDLITFYIGTNDIYRIMNGFDEANVPIEDYNNLAREKYFASFEMKYRKFVFQLKSIHPRATIVVLNLPATNEFAKRLNLEVINPLASDGFTIVDLMSDPASYDAAFYASGPHPNDRGYQHIADKILTVIQAGPGSF